MVYVPVAAVLRLPELYARIVPVPSKLSVQVAPESENVAPDNILIVPDPTSVTTGGVTSASKTFTVRVADPVFPSVSTLRYSIVYVPD